MPAEQVRFCFYFAASITRHWVRRDSSSTFFDFILNCWTFSSEFSLCGGCCHDARLKTPLSQRQSLKHLSYHQNGTNSKTARSAMICKKLNFCNYLWCNLTSPHHHHIALSGSEASCEGGEKRVKNTICEFVRRRYAVVLSLNKNKPRITHTMMKLHIA